MPPPSGWPTTTCMGELWPCQGRSSFTGMADSVLQQQLDEVRALLERARGLFGADPVPPPTDIAPDPDAVQRWVR